MIQTSYISSHKVKQKCVFSVLKNLWPSNPKTKWMSLARKKEKDMYQNQPGMDEMDRNQT
ncbi:hypothetical protein GBA52_003806 [Prunus armeniaca]|nr:hypothetical protein GBA52_003806 [Prunus armeniaca]